MFIGHLLIIVILWETLLKNLQVGLIDLEIVGIGVIQLFVWSDHLVI